MSMDWLRLHHDTSGDGKFRTIARRAKLPMHMIRAVWEEMLINASKADPRGALSGWDHEDVAAILDMEPDEVAAVFDAMQGKTLDGMRLSGWDRRQPKRERGEQPTSTVRVQAHRERQKSAVSHDETPCNAIENHETPRLDKIREERSSAEGAGESALLAVQIIQAFDAARIAAYGAAQARPWPHQKDRTTAQRWLDAGADLDLCREVFGAIFPRKAAARDGPPESLKFFENAIANAIAERNKPMPEGQANGTGNRNQPTGRIADVETRRRRTAESVRRVMEADGRGS